MENKKQHPFDEFLKETLKDHQLVPREKARKAFLEDAASIRPARYGWFRWYYLPLLVVLISGIVATIYFTIPAEEAPAKAGGAISANIPSADPSHISSTPETEKETVTPATAAPLSNTPSAQQNMTTSAATLTDTRTDVKVASPDRETDHPGSGEIKPVIKDETKDAGAESIPVTGDIPVNDVPSEPSVDITVGNEGDSNAVVLAASTDTVVSGEPTGPEPARKSKDEAPAPVFALGIMYLPEYMFNTIEGGKFVNNFGADFTFYKGLVSIRTGLGISVSEGITENEVEYSEYLGSYNKLDSITFIYNESSHDFYPNIHTSSEKVWDEQSSYDSLDIVKRYTYLQVPLILGFDFWQKDRLSIGVRIGTVMSVMLKSKQLTGEYDPGENMVIGISNLTPDRVSMNWQAVGALNATYRLNRRLLLEIEPQAKYYYQSIYEKSGYEKKPWSLGVRTAILYKF